MPSRSIFIAGDWSELATQDGIFLPGLARFPAALRELMGLLPVVDINGELISALAAGPGRAPAGAIAGLFAADPFLDRIELARLLRDRGFARVANFPTVQLFDAGAGAGFASVGYDLAAELSVLRSLADMGFAPVAYVTTTAAAAAALENGFSTLAYHPGLAPARGERPVPARIERMAREAGASLLRHQREPREGTPAVSR